MGVGRKAPQADQPLKKRQKCKKQPVVAPGGGEMARLISQAAHFSHRPPLPLHSGLRFSGQQMSILGEAALGSDGWQLGLEFTQLREGVVERESQGTV